MSGFALIRDPEDSVAASSPVARAVERLRVALSGRGIQLEEVTTAAEVRSDRTSISISGPGAPGSLAGLSSDTVQLLSSHEGFSIVAEGAQRHWVDARGADERGLAYAVLELVDRIEHGEDPIAAVRTREPIVGRPANTVRSVARLFCSEVEDLGWFRDEGFWRRYLAMLIAQRFNRVSLTLGLGYNYHRGITDAYLYFPYPFLLSVLGYDVRIPQLPTEDRDRNLAALRFASEEAVAVGLEFQLGLWTHAYDWIDSPDAHQTVDGLGPENHARYCRDALRELLGLCPAISGLTFRIHGESGIPERSWDFWRTVFEGVRDAGRTVRIDLHAKGLDAPTLDSALETAQPVTVSTKFWAEHMGLPYHQAAIRELERPEREDPSARSEWHRYMVVSEGSRPFTRYGYGDFLREDRPYNVVFRLWAGTQRLLLWGDPAFAAGYGRVSSLAGAQGLEWCEPLTFKGREGTGIPGSRTGYADPSLVPEDDWEKFAHAYRLFGRLTFDPNAGPDSWWRPLRTSFGSAAGHAEASLSAASRILPLVTTAHHPSASNNYFWPEIYTDLPIMMTEDGTRPHPYFDTPEPRRFGTASPLDPEVFSSVSEFAGEFLGESSGRYSPLDVASWLTRFADEAEQHLAAVRSRVPDLGEEVRRWTIDAAVLAGLGRFFAGKIRASVGYELYLSTGERADLEAGLHAYRGAAVAWREFAEVAADVYVRDLTFGPEPHLRGHWKDRLDSIEADLHDMEGLLAGIGRGAGGNVAGWEGSPARLPEVDVIHAAPPEFRPGEDLPVDVEVAGPDADSVRSVTLRYRPMNQALTYAATPLAPDGRGFSGRIPGVELDGTYPLAYAFVLRTDGGIAWRYPGLGRDLAGQPYLTVRAQRRPPVGAD